MERRGWHKAGSALLIGALAATTVSASVIDLGDGGRDASVSRGIVDFGRPAPERVAPSVEDAPARSSPTGHPDVEALVLDVALAHAGHPALRRIGLTAGQWHAFFRSNIAVESAFDPSARSHAGAIGLGQLMPETARALGVDPADPVQNLHGSARYLLAQVERFGSLELALAAYNAGPEAVARHAGIPPYAETRGHVRKVMAIYRTTLGET